LLGSTNQVVINSNRIKHSDFGLNNTALKSQNNKLNFADTKELERSLNGTDTFNQATLYLSRMDDTSALDIAQPGFYEDE
jgi:hypothetical protein